MENTNMRYYQSPRKDLVDIIPKEVKKLLDIGCGEGTMGKVFKQERPDAFVAGIESNNVSTQIAKSNIDDIITGDVETVLIKFPNEHFECIVFGDVLEHLIDPWKQLKKYSKYLCKDGYILVSVPNVSYYSIVVGLMFGRWHYKDRGILDKGHLRFFTLKSLKDLVETAGYKIIKVDKRYRFCERGSRFDRFAKVMMFVPLIGKYFINKHVILAKKQ
ncbi:MAG: hypothetical protein A2252_07435 [Elusimicrobia bacterium RIFOXYA2_FULL_39_19]|nr:MAG: hypothetical protein A2252_07435 [Elusimicrobia bacterium RIFOXYA2_FULL_39_19]